MEKEYWQNSPFGEDSLFHPNFDNTQKSNNKQNPKTAINLLIVLDASGKKQFDDTKNTIWKVYHFLSLSEFEGISSIIRKHTFKNVCLVHHGNVYSTVALPKDEKIVFGVGRIEQMEQIILEVGGKPFIEQDEEYFKSLHEKSLKLFNGGYPINELKALCCLKGIIENISSGGNYFSVACDEADDPKLLEKLSTFSTNSINLFANSNYSIINSSRTYEYGKIKITGYGSILNSYLTGGNWKDTSGWKIFNMSKKELKATNQDLWLFSRNKSKVYELLSRKKDLTKEQLEKELYIQRYYSISFEKWYIKNWGQSAYDTYLKGIEEKYPIVKS